MGLMTADEREAATQEFIKRDTAWLKRKLFREMVKRPGYDIEAVTLEQRLMSQGVSANQYMDFYKDVPIEVKRVLDSTATALVRQDLDPILQALFVRKFPLWERLNKVPSNGLVHAYNQITAPGSTSNTVNDYLITELGTVADDTSTYARKTSFIAVTATRRGVSLKELYAVQQGGAPYNPQATEIDNGMTVLARTMQQLLASGNASGAGGDLATSENGLYTANGFDGLRIILGGGGSNSGNNAVDVDLVGTDSTLTDSINTAAQEIMDNGGTPTAVVGSSNQMRKWLAEQEPQVRYMAQSNGIEIIPGVMATRVTTLTGELPWITVPGGYLGSYTYNTQTVEDVYVLSEDTVDVPWLGGENFTMLEIPIGANAQLSRLFILFGMFGLALKAPPFNAKIRCLK